MRDRERLRIGMLMSANAGLVSVKPQDSVQDAETYMGAHNYSQVGLLKGEHDPVPRAVTWESIGKERLARPEDLKIVAVSRPATVVMHDADLLAEIPTIIDKGFVFVRGSDSKITGIVTTADLSTMFLTLAQPFFLLAEIETTLR